MSTNKKISIITVNYNTSQLINNLLNSLNLISSIIEEVIIVDNKSKDINKLELNKHKVNLIKNNSNLGFSKAVNQGIKIAKSDYILLVNPDTLIDNDSIKTLLTQIKKDKKIGAIGGKIQHMNDLMFQNTATTKPNFFTGLFEFTNLKKVFPNNPFSKHFWIENQKNISKPIQVYSLCGAFILFRKKLNNELNLFNESYFLYMEDVAFGSSINTKGYKVIFDPRVKIKHISGASSNSKYNIVLNHWYKSRKVYFQNNCNYLSGAILNVVFTIEEKILYIYHHIKHEKAY